MAKFLSSGNGETYPLGVPLNPHTRRDIPKKKNSPIVIFPPRLKVRYFQPRNALLNSTLTFGESAYGSTPTWLDFQREFV
jgi:hypothetical protein